MLTTKTRYKSELITTTLLLAIAGVVGCGTEIPMAATTPSASPAGSPAGDAASWCASAATKNPAQFEGMSLKISMTSTLAALDAWRAEQGKAAGFEEKLEDRFPALASRAPTGPLGVCLFTHAPRPIPQPPGANITADGTRGFVTPEGVWVEDAIGSQATLLDEMNQIR